MTTTCSSCGAPIQWAITPAGKRMPVDPEPHSDGNLRLSMETGQLTARIEKPAPLSLFPDDTRRHRSHFVTCPQAAEHRAPRHRPTPDERVRTAADNLADMGCTVTFHPAARRPDTVLAALSMAVGTSLVEEMDAAHARREEATDA